MKSNYQLYQEDFGAIAGGAAATALLGLIMKGVSKKNLDILEDAFLESYEDSFFTMTIEMGEEVKSEFAKFLENVTLNRRVKNKALDEGELVLINNRAAYNKIMQKLGKFPMFSIMKNENEISFKPDEFVRKHKRLYGITGDKFMKMLSTQNKDINNNLIWLHHALKILTKSADNQGINKITFHSYPPKISYTRNM